MSASPAASASETPLPRVFGRYVLFDHIGRGGMAEIFLARAKTTEAGGARLVVVKQILRELGDDPKFSDALVAEAKLAARLSHANVVQVLDLGRAPEATSEGRLYITMEYVEGLDLSELLRRCARQKIALPIEFSLLMVMETLRGLDYAHRRIDDDGRPLGIVHRDVSPSNVLVSVEGEVKVCDFGIARANADGDKKLLDETIQGKAGYMSPEHARGEALDARADVFATGIILWELLAGRRLYKADREKNESLLAVARRAEIAPLPRRNLPAEDELIAIVNRALAVDREQRFASAAEMLAALQAYVGKARLIASPIRLGEWITENFGQELIDARRSRERAVRALESGPALVMTPLAPVAKPAASTPPPPMPAPTNDPTPQAPSAAATVAEPPRAAEPAPTASDERAALDHASAPANVSRTSSSRWLVLVALVAVAVAAAWFFGRR
jgi:serine/threonine protein kinase